MEDKFNALVEELLSLHAALGTNPRWASMDADALLAGEQRSFTWVKLDGSGFTQVEFVFDRFSQRFLSRVRE